VLAVLIRSRIVPMAFWRTPILLVPILISLLRRPIQAARRIIIRSRWICNMWTLLWHRRI